MHGFYESVLNKKSTMKQNTIWYTAGCLCNSASSVLLLLLVTRILGTIEAGVFAIGWTICQQVVTIGWFGTRNFQVSDIQKKYEFCDYLSFKYFTIVIMIIGSFIYMYALRLSIYKCLVSLLLTFLMVSEVFADVFAGQFQLNDKLHISGKSYVVRIIGYDLIFVISLLFTKHLLFSIFLMTIFSYFWLFVWDFQFVSLLETRIFEIKKKKLKQLCKECFPLFISAFLSIFIVSIPKNAIELSLNENIQTVYNIIFMPSSVINMIGLFVFLPLYSKIATLWNEKQYRSFHKILYQIMLFIVGITLFVIIAGYFLGIPVLEMLYQVPLSSYQTSFLVLLLAGGMNCYVNVLNYLITVMRKQTILMSLYIMIVVVAQFIAPSIVKQFGIDGASMIYLGSILVICIVLTMLLIYFYRKEIKNK